MVWRPWVIFTTLLAVVLLNLVLLFQEKVPTPQTIQEVKANQDVLRLIQYTKGQRRGNFRLMGMSDEMANETAERIDSYKGQLERLQKMIKDEADVAGTVFCTADSGWPPPYAALEVLVKEENAKRDVVPVSRLLKFDKQPWFGNAPIDGVYNAAEFSERREEDATLMGIAALLLTMEPDIIEGNSPFSRGALGTWSFKKLENDAKTARITEMVKDYFSLMHFLVELANEEEKGICF